MIVPDVNARFLIDTGRDGFTLPDDDYTAVLAMFEGSRGFDYNPEFSFSEGSAKVKLVNDDGVMNNLIDVGLTVKMQLYNDTLADWQTVWSGFIESYERETGASAAFINLKCVDGVYNLKAIDTRNAVFVDQHTLEIVYAMLGDYTNPILPKWVLGQSALGTGTVLGGTLPGIEGSLDKSPLLAVYIPDRASEGKAATRVAQNRITDATSVIADLLNVDGSLLYLTAENNPVVVAYKDGLVAKLQAAPLIDLDTDANKSVFRSVSLRQVVTKVTVEYETASVVTNGVLGSQETGGDMDPNETKDFDVAVGEGIVVSGTTFTASYISTGSTTNLVTFDGEKFTVSITDTSGVDNNIEDIKVRGDGYLFNKETFERQNDALRARYGLAEKSVTNNAIDSAAQAASLASRVISYNGISLDRIKYFVMSKRFLQGALEFELSDIVKLSETKSDINSLPHIITGFDYKWTPNDCEIQVKAEIFNPRIWILGTSVLGTSTYI